MAFFSGDPLAPSPAPPLGARGLPDELPHDISATAPAPAAFLAPHDVSDALHWPQKQRGWGPERAPNGAQQGTKEGPERALQRNHTKSPRYDIVGVILETISGPSRPLPRLSPRSENGPGGLQARPIEPQKGPKRVPLRGPKQLPTISYQWLFE